MAWFTVDAFDRDTYAISEYGHWERVHAYLFLGEEGAVLVDSGTGIGDIREVVDALTDLPLVVVTTHAHWDHIGGHGRFNRFAIHGGDLDWIRNGLPLSREAILESLVKEDFTEDPPEGFDLSAYEVFRGDPAYVLLDQDELDLGGRILNVLHTPGHSPGHICVFDPDAGYLATGDLLYEGTLYAHFPSTDPQAFAASLRRLSALPPVSRILPGHNELDLGPEILGEAIEAVDALEAKKLLRHGTGLHRFGRLAVKL